MSLQVPLASQQFVWSVWFRSHVTWQLGLLPPPMSHEQRSPSGEMLATQVWVANAIPPSQIYLWKSLHVFSTRVNKKYMIEKSTYRTAFRLRCDNQLMWNENDTPPCKLWAPISHPICFLHGELPWPTVSASHHFWGFNSSAIRT